MPEFDPIPVGWAAGAWHAVDGGCDAAPAVAEFPDPLDLGLAAGGGRSAGDARFADPLCADCFPGDLGDFGFIRGALVA